MVSGAREAVPRVVIVTGASSGIGRCTAALFARRGWRVGLIARGAAGLLAARHDGEAAGACVATAQADVADSAALAEAAEAIIAALGPADVWINCAGNGVYGRFDDVPEAEFQRVTDVTYHGTVNGTRVIPFTANGKPGAPVTFIDGFSGATPASRNTSKATYRPGGVAMAPDGSLYVADTQKGRIWHIYYDGK